MRNEKGQALVEFILILPVFLLFIIGTIDIGNMIYEKYKLEDHLDHVVELYRNDKDTQLNNYVGEIHANLEITPSGNGTTIELSKTIKITTPILNKIIGKNNTIRTSRRIYEESDE